MTEQSLETIAGDLAERLEASDASLTPAERQALLGLRRTITATLERTHRDPAPDEGHHDLLERLRGRVDQLEREHPDLVALVDRVARALSNAGI